MNLGLRTTAKREEKAVVLFSSNLSLAIRANCVMRFPFGNSQCVLRVSGCFPFGPGIEKDLRLPILTLVVDEVWSKGKHCETTTHALALAPTVPRFTSLSK